MTFRNSFIRLFIYWLISKCSYFDLYGIISIAPERHYVCLYHVT